MNKTGTRLSIAFLGYFILIILLLTLNPFYLTRPERIYFTFDSELNNWLANILLFLPIGFFYRLTDKQRGVLLLGAIISISIETIQLFIPARTPSIVDIVANTTGSGLGAILYDAILKRIAISKGMIGQLRLETPLMGLIYLMVPLLWVNSFFLYRAPDRILLTSLIGLIGTVILSELFRHWWKSNSYRIAGYAAISAGIWFYLGTSPAFRWSSSLMLVTGLGIMLITAILTRRSQNEKDRRFEQSTLKIVFPIFAIYLILIALWEPIRPWTIWHWALGFTNNITETSLQVLIPRLEYLIAFTILGYLLAEWHGRSETPLILDLPRLFLYATTIALALEFIVGFQIGPGASLIRAVMATIS
ncbi:MAG TPA: VanZ family protein, partial [Anaerolineales bacterium]|nr:VanZ family protein [Anaerolineales bacterium]